MSLPIIVNLDSAFDWTAEVLQVWERLDWDGIRQRITPQISSESWLSRGNKLAMVGLVSSLAIDDSYHLPQWENTREGAQKDEDRLSRDWRERQLGKRERETGNDRSCWRAHFTGQEPFFRSPRLGRAGVVECYGIYVEAAAPILSSHLTSIGRTIWRTGRRRHSCRPAFGAGGDAALDRALAVATDHQAHRFDRVPAIRLIEACADVVAILGSLARWLFVHFTVELESVAAKEESDDVHDAASRAVASLRAAMKREQ